MCSSMQWRLWRLIPLRTESKIESEGHKGLENVKQTGTKQMGIPQSCLTRYGHSTCDLIWYTESLQGRTSPTNLYANPSSSL
jgi:hypothetical protein